MATSEELVNDLTWRHLNIEALVWRVNPDLKSALVPKSYYDDLCAGSPLSFAVGILDVILSPYPPSVAFFEFLPNPQKHQKLWGVYGLVLAKSGCKPKVYLGSGTETLSGCSGRLAVYYNPNSQTLPRFVEAAFKDGYILSHSGLLCWCPIPLASLVPRLRARFLAIEALFTSIFFAAHLSNLDNVWRHALIIEWVRDDVEYGPLCSHSPLNERPVGDLGLSAEQLEANDAVRKDSLTARKRDEKRNWIANNQVKAYDIERKSINQTIEAKKHYCPPCDISFGKPGLLAKHLLTQAHHDKALNVEKNGSYQRSGNALRTAKCTQSAKESKKFFCSLCDMAFGRQAHLLKHNNSKAHLAKAAYEPSSAADQSQ
jgi:hypothetical protein